ncbi:unnamed protein product [Darwinula stevensoni]|uniref:Gamma-glutamyltransferase n=1 Tax=Darwinula stevensoni TaxID=69355 RepID=A0A7R8X6P2_9CRUS|nr:unnamed protein product [Darwinula stevensoni]CAG0882313.1 unnamed protein product [Darwinula stevensoni]
MMDGYEGMEGDFEEHVRSRIASMMVPVSAPIAGVVCDHHLASQIGLDILKAGGNAIEAAVATFSALSVLQPWSCGLGGDIFCMFYESSSRQVHGINGSGRCPMSLTLEKLKDEGYNEENPLPQSHPFSVTVSLQALVEPSVKLARTGFKLTHYSSEQFRREMTKLIGTKHGFQLLLPANMKDGLVKNPGLAQTLEIFGTEGKHGFYEGEVEESIVGELALENQGEEVMTEEDLLCHITTWDHPIRCDYRKQIRVWEMPPNTHGLIVLLTLNILENYDIKQLCWSSPIYLHCLIEALRLSFADAFKYVCDPKFHAIPMETLLSKAYALQRWNLIHHGRAMEEVGTGAETETVVKLGADTTYVTAVDGEGNACSFIASNCSGVGSGIVPDGRGFSLQNRGLAFNLKEGHVNKLHPGKRPYHTIIPGMVTDLKTGDVIASFGIMGGPMQPQGHVQVLLNMVDFGMNPQRALNQPRLFVDVSCTGTKKPPVYLEEGFPSGTAETLRAMGHNIQGPVTGFQRRIFGRGHVAAKRALWNHRHESVDSDWYLGSDPRSDGIPKAF